MVLIVLPEGHYAILSEHCTHTTLQTNNIAVFIFHLGSILNRFSIGSMGEYFFLGEEDPDLIPANHALNK